MVFLIHTDMYSWLVQRIGILKGENISVLKATNLNRGMTSSDNHRWLLPAVTLNLNKLDKQWATCLSDVTGVCEPADSINMACSKHCESQDVTLAAVRWTEPVDPD